ncbi:hypothetical protein, partial [Vibrio campbellii]
IIKESSPIITGQNGEDTKEKSILRFLSTGKDDSGIVSKPKKDVISNRKGRMEFIDHIIDEYNSELNEKNYCMQDESEIDSQITKLENSIEKLSFDIQSQYDRVSEFETTIDDSWKEWNFNESRLLNVEELLSRSDLLSQHYFNDIERLQSVQETSSLFLELEFGNCPMCKKTLGGDGHVECNTDDIETISTSSMKEIEKIKNLISELDVTRDVLKNEKAFLIDEIKINKENHFKYQEELKNFTSRNLKSNLEKLDVFKAKLNEQSQVKRIMEKISSLSTAKSEYKIEIDPMDGNYNFDNLTTSNVTKLCNTIKTILIDWGYGDIESVSFSEESSDLIIDGEHRQLAGKGYRALSYSAFIIGLMQDCISNNRGHSGVVLLDSPLCTLRSRHIAKSKNYQEKDIISNSIKEKFYASISKYSSSGQVIILENDGPAEPGSLNLGFTEFTEDRNRGRYGFYPIK